MRSSTRKKTLHCATEKGRLHQPPDLDPLTLLVTEFALIHGLSGRESDVCLLLSRGLSEKMIGDALSLGSHTAEVYLRRAYQKVGVNSRNDLRHAIVNFAADSWHEALTRTSDVADSVTEPSAEA